MCYENDSWSRLVLQFLNYYVYLLGIYTHLLIIKRLLIPYYFFLLVTQFQEEKNLDQSLQALSRLSCSDGCSILFAALRHVLLGAMEWHCLKLNVIPWLLLALYSFGFMVL